MISETLSDGGLAPLEYSSSEGHTLADDDMASMLVLGNASDVCFTDTNQVLSTADEEAGSSSCKSSLENVPGNHKNEIKDKCRRIRSDEGLSNNGKNAVNRCDRSQSSNAAKKTSYTLFDQHSHSEIPLSRTSSCQECANLEGIRNVNHGHHLHNMGKNKKSFPHDSVSPQEILHLNLNVRNLYEFKEKVQRGDTLPLRTDFVDTRDYRTVRSNVGRKGEKDEEKNDMEEGSDCNGSFSIRSQGMPTVMLSSSIKHSAHGNTTAGVVPTPPPLPSYYRNCHGNWERGGSAMCNQRRDRSPSYASSLTSPSDLNTLNVSNLNRHVKILSSGIPVNLLPENIGVSLEGGGERLNEKGKSHAHPETPDAPSFCENSGYPCSLRVEQHRSESSLTAGDTGSPLTEGSPKTSEGDMWSFQSVGDRGLSDFITESNLRSLSIENLLQLKRELQSNSMPLRPELLAGLELAVKAMSTSGGGPSSEEGQSLLVASSGNATRGLTTVDAERSHLERELEGKDMEGRRERSYELGVLHDLDHVPGGSSFHSMLVEAAPTELHEVKDNESSSSVYPTGLHTLEERSTRAIPDENDDDRAGVVDDVDEDVDDDDRDGAKRNYFSDEDNFRGHSCSSNVSNHGSKASGDCCPNNSCPYKRHKGLTCTPHRTSPGTSPRKIARRGTTSSIDSCSHGLFQALESTTHQLKEMEYALEKVVRLQQSFIEVLCRSKNLPIPIYSGRLSLSANNQESYHEVEQRPIGLTIRLRRSPLVRKATEIFRKGINEPGKEKREAMENGVQDRKGTHGPKEDVGSNAQGVRVSDGLPHQEDLVKRQDITPDDEMEFLVPFYLYTTVGECKKTALERLHRIHVLESSTINSTQGRFFYKKKLLFDEDNLFSLGIKTGDTVELEIFPEKNSRKLQE